MNDCEVRKWRVRRLHENENVRFFTCGDSDLDDYILNEASSYQSELLMVLLKDQEWLFSEATNRFTYRLLMT